MNCCAGEDEAGGCILIETNLPNANAADSSIAGCIFSLTHNICLVFCVSTQCSRGKASSPTDGVERGEKKRLFIVEPAVSESCKNFGEPRRATGWRYVMLSENVETNKS